MNCTICPQNCNVDRDTKFGVCQAPADFKISHIQSHHWEEPCISGTKGSGTIFLTHCNLKCVFCQNFKISQLSKGKIITEKEFLKHCLNLKEQGAHNINLVSPTCYSHLLIKVLPKIKSLTKLPIVWNSNAYEKIETLKKLDGLVDIYLPDLKYYANDLAIKYSQAPNYFPTAMAAIKEMVRQVGKVELDANGIIRKGVIIRHLVLPGQIEDSKKVLQAIKENFGNKVWVSLMAQYYPAYLVKQYPEINQALSEQAYEKIKEFYDKLDFAGGYFQELDSASDSYIPQWELGSLDLV